MLIFELPPIIKTKLINYLTNNQPAPTLQKYLNSALEAREHNYFSIRCFAKEPLAAAGIEYACDYIRYVVGSSDNIIDLSIAGKVITITVKDISKVIWNYESENKIYQFLEHYLFNDYLQMTNETNQIQDEQILFQNIKSKVNIDYLDNNFVWVISGSDNENLNKIKVKLVSDDQTVNQALFENLKAAIKADQEEQLLTKSALKVIKNQIFIKNNWEKYQTLAQVSDDKDIRLLNVLIKNISNFVIEQINDETIAIDNFKESNFYYFFMLWNRNGNSRIYLTKN